ncbi:MAG: hypothetical protein H6611_05320 [Ignavibacteriales bacterium]|nr:hypothetical protein [Ignavibacteriales bacterium]
MWAYYIDEPADLGDNLNEWISNTNWIKNKYSDSKIIISGYKRDENLKEYVRTIADKTMFSSYVHWWNIPLTNLWVAWPENPDQRSDWADMKSLFGNKFDFTWIGAHMDYAEYDDLMGKAKNLNLLGIFLYQKEPHDTEVDDNNLNKLSEAAVKHGYLEKYYQQVRNYYENGILKFSQFVGPEYSSDIPTEFNHSELIFNDYTVTNNRVEDYFAESRIIVGSPFVFTVPNAKKSSLNSNNEIILKPGFHAENGSEFRAYIGQ